MHDGGEVGKHAGAEKDRCISPAACLPYAVHMEIVTSASTSPSL